MIQTKKQIRIMDSVNRDILRLMYHADRPLTGNQISKKVRISQPAINPRLQNLQNQGIIKTTSIGRIRVLNSKKKIKAPSRIFWGLDWK